MKYAIVYLIRGEAKKRQEEIMEELSEKFKIRNLNEHIPVHITLKSPFETDKIKDVEPILKEFVKMQSASGLKLDGFGSFHDKVIFIKPIYSDGAKKIFENFLKELERLSWMRFRKYDKEHVPHATIGYAQGRKKFKLIMDYVSSKKFKFDLQFDNIAILKKPEKNWIVHKIYEIS